MFSLDVTLNIADLEVAFTEGMQTLDTELAEAVEQAVQAGADEARDNHNYQNQTYRLERSTRGFMVGRHDGVIEAGMDYAEWVERHQRVGGFMARAERLANSVLQIEVERAVDQTAAVINRR